MDIIYNKRMDETFKWSGHLPVLVILATLAMPMTLYMPLYMFRMGGFAIVVVIAPLLILFGAPIMHLQVLSISNVSIKARQVMKGLNEQLSGCCFSFLGSGSVAQCHS